MCIDVEAWINHLKEGCRRQEKDLIYFDKLWQFITDLIVQLQEQTLPLEEEKDFVEMIRYEGTLYRMHKKYEKSEKNYGVIPTEHYVSLSFSR